MPWLVVGLVFGLMAGFVVGFVVGLSVGLATGLVVGVVAASTVDTGEYSVAEPQEIIRRDLTVGLVVGLLGGLVVGLAAGLVGGLVVGLVAGLVGGLAAGLIMMAAVVRYISLLLCTRRWTTLWLPWRLGRFMNWCYQAGLFRVAGMGYQFRHKELLDYLTRPTGTDKEGPARSKPGSHAGNHPGGQHRPTPD